MRWYKRFQASTRGRILDLLRRSEGTVSELSAALELTDNAVRAHLASLERDGLVEQRGIRRGVGKPANVYGLAAEAERLLPKAYGRVLGLLLEVLEDRHGVEEATEILEEAGRRAASTVGVPAGGASGSAEGNARLEAALALVGELGGVAEIEEREGGVRIQGYSCPLAAVVPEHPRVCRLVEALLTEVVGLPVRERCARGEHPRCAFEVVESGTAGG